MALLGAGVFGLAELWKRVQRRRRRERLAAGVCAVCGYDLRSLLEDRCPECGTTIPRSPYDHAPKIGWGRQTVAVLGVWVAAVALLAVMTARLLQRAGPIDYKRVCYVDIAPAAATSTQTVVTIYAQTGGTLWWRFADTPTSEPQRWYVYHYHQRGASVVTATSSWGSRLEDATGVWGEPTGTGIRQIAGEDDVLAWFRASGADPANPEVRAPARALGRILRDAELVGIFHAIAQADAAEKDLGVSIRATVNVTREGWPRLVCEVASTAVWGLIGLLGCAGIGVRYAWRTWKQPRKRGRTASVMFVDLVGYTAQASRESRAGLIALLMRQRVLVEAVVLPRGGKIVKSLGDGLLVTLPSATEAILAAAEIQKRGRTNGDGAAAATSAAGELPMRIGISTGDVVTHDGDIYGDCVNVASRLQSLASPGEVFFSEASYQTMNRGEIRHELVGEVQLKGVFEKVRVFRALLVKGNVSEPNDTGSEVV
jgi:class 3 adenylate cyclase